MSLTKITENISLRKIKVGIILAILFCFGFFQSAMAADSAAIVAYILPLNSFLYELMMSMFKLAIYLAMSASLLQTVISNPGWIDVDSDFVQVGLNVTMTLADICLIAVFVAIAIGYVFKVETFQSEKALPKFFIVALLIHFSPLFVKMVIDLSNIAAESLIVGHQTIILDSCKDFAKELMASGGALMRNYVINAAGAAIPIASLAASAVRVSGLLAINGWIATSFPHYIIQIMVGQILSGLMYSYAVFFITRVFMIQILAVLAPLAILASVLPQTSSLFSTWTKWLIGWAIAGPMTIFLLTLGLSTLQSLLPALSSTYVSLGGTYNIFLRQDTMYWFMICIYMMTAGTIVAGTIPSISGEVEKKISSGLKPLEDTGGSLAKTAKQRFESGSSMKVAGKDVWKTDDKKDPAG